MFPVDYAFHLKLNIGKTNLRFWANFEDFSGKHEF